MFYKKVEKIQKVFCILKNGIATYQTPKLNMLRRINNKLEIICFVKRNLELFGHVMRSNDYSLRQQQSLGNNTKFRTKSFSFNNTQCHAVSDLLYNSKINLITALSGRLPFKIEIDTELVSKREIAKSQIKFL